MFHARNKFTSAMNKLAQSRKRALGEDQKPQHTPWQKKPRLTPGENGAPAYKSTGVARLDLFGQLVRDIDCEFINRLAAAAWTESAEQTLQIAMNCRDIRKGKGERTCALELMLWIRQHKPMTYKRNLDTFLEMGCFRDLLVLAKMVEEHGLPLLGTNEILELELMAYHLSQDQRRLIASELVDEAKDDAKDDVKDEKKIHHKQPILTLASKWAPSEKSKFKQFALRLAAILFPNSKCQMKDYRVMRSTLNKQLNITERLVCENRWSEIDFEKVPALCHKKLRKAFAKHAPSEYEGYKAKLKTGEKKIKSTGVMPHEMVVAVQSDMDLDSDSDTEKDTDTNQETEIIDAQWADMIKKLRQQNCKFSNCVSMVDVSGSMVGHPMNAAVALGLVIAELTEGAYHDRFITFSSNPDWHIIMGDTLKERVQSVRGANWGQSTNLEAAFRLILDTAVENKVAAADLPKTLFIFSDLQFDVATGRDLNVDKTWLVNIDELYQTKGYTRPNIVFWNLRATENFPVKHDDVGVCMLSGFSANAMKVILEKGTITPLDTMLETIKPYTVTVEESERG